MVHRIEPLFRDVTLVQMPHIAAFSFNALSLLFEGQRLPPAQWFASRAR